MFAKLLFTLGDYLVVLPWSGTFSRPWTFEMLLPLVTFPQANSVDNMPKHLAWSKRSFTSCLSKASISSTYSKNVLPRSWPESVVIITITSPGVWEPECKKGVVLKISNDTKTHEETLMPCTMLNLIPFAAPTDKAHNHNQLHHNQLLKTKFGRILCLTRKWRKKIQPATGLGTVTEKTWGRGWVVLVVEKTKKIADISLVLKIITTARTRRNNS